MTLGVPFCDTPGQSAVVGVGAGLLGGATGLALGLDAAGVAVLAGSLALAGELLGHVLRGDRQFRDAAARVRDRLARPDR